MSNTDKTALVVGATGATGQYVVKLLLQHPKYQSVVVFTRRVLSYEHPKLTTHIVDFDYPEQWSDLLAGDELFSALGTTRKIAGSKQAQYKVDYTYQYNTAAAAKANGVPAMLLVSSPSADPDSLNFYLRTKGELDAAVSQLGFEHLVLIKPSLIDGQRSEFRLAEKVATFSLTALGMVFSPIKKYQPISGKQLAKAMVNIAQKDLVDAVTEFEFEQLFDFID